MESYISKLDKKAQFWKTLFRAIETEPREAKSISGASGLVHPVVALGIDESRRRVVIITGDSDPRSAAMAQADIQTMMPSVKTIMARPVPVNLAAAAKIITGLMGKVSIGPKDLESLSRHSPKDMQKIFNKFAKKIGDKLNGLIIRPFQFAAVDFAAGFKEIIQQLSFVEIDRVEYDAPNLQNDKSSKKQIPNIRLSSLIALDPTELDRRMGICSIPLYEFSEPEAEVFHIGKDLDYAKEILKNHDILQYFFPPADHLALGLAEQKTSSTTEIVDRLTRVPQVGHPFGKPEILSPSEYSIPDIIDGLKERRLLVEGEVGIEVTPQGESLRAKVRFKPREGLLARLSRIFSMKIDLSLKDFFK